jgi:hypothetical protein
MSIRYFTVKALLFVSVSGASAVQVPSNSWMGALPPGLKVSEIPVIPGSIDAGTPGQPQPLVISDQLHLGVRALDLRLYFESGLFVSVYVSTPGHKLVTLREALKSVKQFIKGNPSEFVILFLSRGRAAKLERKYLGAINLELNKVSKYVLSPVLEFGRTLLSTAKGKMILVSDIDGLSQPHSVWTNIVSNIPRQRDRWFVDRINYRPAGAHGINVVEAAKSNEERAAGYEVAREGLSKILMMASVAQRGVFPLIQKCLASLHPGETFNVVKPVDL